MFNFKGGFGKDIDLINGGVVLIIFDFGIGWCLVNGEIFGVISLEICD